MESERSSLMESERSSLMEMLTAHRDLHAPSMVAALKSGRIVEQHENSVIVEVEPGGTWHHYVLDQPTLLYYNNWPIVVVQ